jgi:hypothetical protein
VVASWPGVSSTPVLITRTWVLHRGFAVSGGDTWGYCWAHSGASFGACGSHWPG